MKNIIVCTDCTGIKQSAIESVFDLHIPNTEITVIKNEVSFNTPLEYAEFYSVIGKQMLHLRDSLSGEAYCVSIQKGYYKLRLQWQFSAITSIRSPNGRQVQCFASSVPVTEKASWTKTKEPLKNFSDILAEEFPECDKNTESVYTLLTEGKAELEWLQEPVHNCVTYLLR